MGFFDTFDWTGVARSGPATSPNHTLRVLPRPVNGSSSMRGVRAIGLGDEVSMPSPTPRVISKHAKVAPRIAPPDRALALAVSLLDDLPLEALAELREHLDARLWVPAPGQDEASSGVTCVTPLDERDKRDTRSADVSRPTVVTAEEPGPSPEATAAGGPKRARLNGVAAIALQALQEALEAHGEPLPAAVGVASGARAVPSEAWRQRAYERLGQEMKTDARRQAFCRARKRLVDQGLVACEQGWAWLP